MSLTTDRGPSGGQAATPNPSSGWGAQRSPGKRQGGDRLPARPRERKPALAALAVLLILGGALASLSLVLRSGQTVAAIGIARPVARGERIPLGALRQVQVARTGVDYVPWEQRNQVVRYFAAVPLVPRSLLAHAQVSMSQGVRRDQVVVGLALKPGQLPAGQLHAGDIVRVYSVVASAAAQNSGSTSQSKLLVEAARIYSVRGADEAAVGESTVQMSIAVGVDEAGPVTQAAANGNVALVLVPQVS
jgi:hypothetical protein